MSTPEKINECQLCEEVQKKAGNQPEKLVMLPVTTEKLGIPIVVCAFCDGGVLEQVKKTWNWSDEQI